MSNPRLGLSVTQQSTAAALAGLTTLSLLWGLVGLAEGYRADGAWLSRSQPAQAQGQASRAPAPAQLLAARSAPQA